MKIFGLRIIHERSYQKLLSRCLDNILNRHRGGRDYRRLIKAKDQLINEMLISHAKKERQSTVIVTTLLEKVRRLELRISRIQGK